MRKLWISALSVISSVAATQQAPSSTSLQQKQEIRELRIGFARISAGLDSRKKEKATEALKEFSFAAYHQFALGFLTHAEYLRDFSTEHTFSPMPRTCSALRKVLQRAPGLLVGNQAR